MNNFNKKTNLFVGLTLLLKIGDCAKDVAEIDSLSGAITNECFRQGNEMISASNYAFDECFNSFKKQYSACSKDNSVCRCHLVNELNTCAKRNCIQGMGQNSLNLDELDKLCLIRSDDANDVSSDESEHHYAKDVSIFTDGEFKLGSGPNATAPGTETANRKVIGNAVVDGVYNRNVTQYEKSDDYAYKDSLHGNRANSADRWNSSATEPNRPNNATGSYTNGGTGYTGMNSSLEFFPNAGDKSCLPNTLPVTVFAFGLVSLLF